MNSGLWISGACFGVSGGYERPMWFAKNGENAEYKYSYNYQNWYPSAEFETKNTRENIGLFVICLAMIGDGFAEPVGIRFGKRRYKTFALFTRKRYFRTVEGSLAVFIATFFVVVVFH